MDTLDLFLQGIVEISLVASMLILLAAVFNAIIKDLNEGRK